MNITIYNRYILKNIKMVFLIELIEAFSIADLKMSPSPSFFLSILVPVCLYLEINYNSLLQIDNLLF